MPQEDMSRNAGTAMLRRLTECVRSVQRRAPRSGRSAAADASGAPGGQILHVTISLQGCVYAGALVLESR